MALEDLSDAVLLLASGTYTVTRRGPAVRDGFGRALPPTVSTFSVTCSAQPASGRDAQLVPEGWRSREMLTLYSPKRLIAPTEPGTLADVVTIDGDDYEVMNVQSWGALGNYWRAVLTRLPT